MSKLLFVVAALAVGGAATAAKDLLSRDTRLPGSCISDSASFSKSVLGKVRKTISDPRLAAVRTTMGIAELPADSAVLVSDPAICRKASSAVADYRQMDQEAVELVLIRIGRRYWAEDGRMLGGEWPLVFLLDSTAAKVIAQH